MQHDDASFAVIENGPSDTSAAAAGRTRRRAAREKPAPEKEGRDNDFRLNDLLEALQAIRGGDFSARLPGNHTGIAGKIADTFNDIVAANERMARQLEHVGQVVGREGRTRQREDFGLSSGAWGDMEASVNVLIEDLLWPITEVTRTISAVAKGDLLQTVPLEVDGRK